MVLKSNLLLINNSNLFKNNIYSLKNEDELQFLDNLLSKTSFLLVTLSKIEALKKLNFRIESICNYIKQRNSPKPVEVKKGFFEKIKIFVKETINEFNNDPKSNFKNALIEFYNETESYFNIKLEESYFSNINIQNWIKKGKNIDNMPLIIGKISFLTIYYKINLFSDKFISEIDKEIDSLYYRLTETALLTNKGYSLLHILSNESEHLEETYLHITWNWSNYFDQFENEIQRFLNFNLVQIILMDKFKLATEYYKNLEDLTKINNNWHLYKDKFIDSVNNIPFLTIKGYLYYILLKCLLKLTSNKCMNYKDSETINKSINNKTFLSLTVDEIILLSSAELSPMIKDCLLDDFYAECKQNSSDFYFLQSMGVLYKNKWNIDECIDFLNNVIEKFIYTEFEEDAISLKSYLLNNKKLIEYAEIKEKSWFLGKSKSREIYNNILNNQNSPFQIKSIIYENKLHLSDIEQFLNQKK